MLEVSKSLLVGTEAVKLLDPLLDPDAAVPIFGTTVSSPQCAQAAAAIVTPQPEAETAVFG